MELEKEKLSRLFDVLGPQMLDMLDSAPEQIQQCAFAGLVFMGSMYLSHVKQCRAQEDQRRQNEDIKDIQQRLANLQKEQTESIRKERMEWAEKEARYEAGAVSRDKQIQELKDELSNREKEFHELTQQHKVREAEMEEKYRTCQTETEEKYREIQEHWALYHQYKEWIAENSSRILLNRLDSSSFETFIACCSKSGIFKYIFERINADNIWGWDKAGIEILDRVINCCITLQGNKFSRTEPQKGGFYDPAQHKKREDAPSSGRITDVLLRGVAENGLIVECCKSYVELESE